MRQFVIRVTIYEPEESAPGLTAVKFPFLTGGHYDITINKQELLQTNNFNPSFALAHEFGHIVAAETGSIDAAPLREGIGVDQYFTDLEFRLKIENEAWDAAELVLARKTALDMHKRGFENMNRIYICK